VPKRRDFQLRYSQHLGCAGPRELAFFEHLINGIGQTELGLTFGGVGEPEVSEDVGSSASYAAPTISFPDLCRLGHPQIITLDALCLLWHNYPVAWEVEGTDAFADWFEALTDDEQVSVGRVVELLVEHGPSLPFPYSSGIATSRHRHMRELRIQHEGRPYRVLYAFDPRRAAILLLGGDKTGNDRWYDEHAPIADKLYDEYLRQLEREGLI
jgi:hypothetical protein